MKELAQATASATEDITRRIRAIQQDTGGAVEKMAAFEEVAGVAGSTRNGAKAARDSAHELGRTAHALSSLVSTIRY
ncbi:MAG TPA: hypothetical protein VGD11_01840 [Mycobacteriales bacterium]